jgi:hypothetical protein
VVAYRAPFYGQLSGKLSKGVRAVAIAASRDGYLLLTSGGRVLGLALAAVHERGPDLLFS